MNSRLLPSLALVIAVGIFFAYVNPTWTGSIATAKAAIAADDASLVAARHYVTQQNELAAERDAIDPKDLSSLTTFLPDSVNNVGLILDLNTLAARTGFSITSIDVTGSTKNGSSAPSAAPGSSAAGDLVGTVDLSLSAQGTFSSLQTFLMGIEKSGRLLDVQDIVVRDSETGIYSYQMRIRLYWLR